MPGAQPPRHVDQPEVGDDGVAVLEEDVLGLEVLVHDAPVVEVPHALRDLLRDDHQLVHRELVLAQVQVRVQGVPLK